MRRHDPAPVAMVPCVSWCDLGLPWGILWSGLAIESVAQPREALQPDLGVSAAPVWGDHAPQPA